MTGTSEKHEFYGSEGQKSWLRSRVPRRPAGRGCRAAPAAGPSHPRSVERSSNPERYVEFPEDTAHAKLTNIDDTGHMVVGDRNDQFSQAILEFLKSLHGEEYVGLDNAK